MKYFLKLLAMFFWAFGYPLFSYYSWPWPPTLDDFAWADWAVMGVDAFIYLFVLGDLSRWLEKS